jgi:pyruvate,water dikinase
VTRYIVWFREIRLKDLPRVGGKNASLGELYGELTTAGLRVPNGFAVTGEAYAALLDESGLRGHVAARLQGISGEDVGALAAAAGAVRRLILEAAWPAGLEQEIREAYAALAQDAGSNPSVAVRSSATAEDLPDASFAGQQETYLGVRGADALVAACRRCFASLFTDRAIVYRIQHGFEHLAVRLSIGVQRMVRADLGAAGSCSRSIRRAAPRAWS